MVEQLKSMSATEQQELARQYGVKLPAASTASAAMPALATPGAVLPAPVGMTQNDIDAATPDKTEEVKPEPAPGTEEHFQS